MNLDSVRERLGDLDAAIRSEKPTIEKYRSIRNDRKLLRGLVYREMIDQSGTTGGGKHE